jgi:type I restriction enzyme S subunit
MKRFIDPSYTLPDGWYASKLIELAEIHNNRRKPINSLERVNMKGPFPYCGANNVVDYINKYEFDGEYLLIAEDGGYWGKNEPTSYIMRGKFWVNNHAHIVKAKEGKTTNQFLCYILNYLNLDPIIGGDARGKLTKAVLTELLIPHPDFPEQRKIAYVLSTVQKAIEQQDKLIRTTTELKKALMQKLFTQGTKGEKLKQTEIGWVPKSWEVVTIESLFDIQQGKQVSKSNRVGTNQKPFLRTANVFWGYIDFTELDEMHFSDEEESKFTLKRDDLLVCEGGDVGRTAIWEYDKQEIYYQNHLHRLRRKKDDIIPKYFMYWMSFIVQETSYVKDAGNRTTIPNLSKSRLGSLYFPKPGIQYQEKVVSILQGLDNKINFLQKKKQTLTDLFKTLLHELMTGQRRVHELEFEFEGLNKEYKIVEQPLSMVAEK